MGRQKKHDTNNDRLKSHRVSKIKNSTNKAFCDVCKDFIECNGEVSDALQKHRNSSKRHREIVDSKKSNRSLIDVDVDLLSYQMDMCSDDIEQCVSCKIPSSTSLPRSSFDEDLQTNDIDIEDHADESESDEGSSVEMEEDSMIIGNISDEREFQLLNTSLTYGRKTVYNILESPILNIQETLLKGFNKIVEGKSPYEFSKVYGREVDWVTALEITRDFIQSNESILLGNRRIETTSTAVKRESGRPARLPKLIVLLLERFFGDGCLSRNPLGKTLIEILYKIYQDLNSRKEMNLVAKEKIKKK